MMWAIRLHICSIGLMKTIIYGNSVFSNTCLSTSAHQRMGWKHINWRGKLGHLKGSSNGLLPNQSSEPKSVQFSSCPFGDNVNGNKLFQSSRDTVLFPYCTPVFFLIVCLKSDVELNSRFVFYFKCIPYRLWHKWGVYHSVSPRTMIHKETPFTDCQQIKSLGEQALRVLRFRVSWGWAGTQCAFQVGKSVQFTITRQGGAAGAEEVKEANKMNSSLSLYFFLISSMFSKLRH